MKKIVLTAILVTAFIAVNVTLVQAQSPEQLYQKGLMKEEGEGSLQEAIGLFSQVADNSKADQSLRAKALLHAGMCYEKMGKQEAVKAYQRLVNTFPAQKSEVTIARERLSRLLQIAEKASETQLIPKFTKINIPTKLSWAVKLSPDGKTLAHIADKKLWTTPLSGYVGPDFPGKPVELNTEGVEVEWTGLAWSGDGKWIAFNEIPLKGKPEKEKNNQSIFIMPSAGGKPKKVIDNYRDARAENYQISLSPDGKKMAFSSVENNEQHIYITQADGGLPKQLVDIQAREPVFSPDGKWIAYVEDKNIGRLGGNLWIVPAAGGVPRLVARAGNASSPLWSPDGSMIAYLDNVKNKQINFIQVPKDGEDPLNVTSVDASDGIENIRLLAGWTPDNRIGSSVTSKQEFSLYTLPVTGGQAAIVLHDCFAYQPRWSPDGKQIYYVMYPKEKGSDRFYYGVIASVPAQGGSGKPVPGNPVGEVIRQLPYQSGNRISPDGKTMISSAYTSADTVGKSNWPNSKIWKISMDGGDLKQITSHTGRNADMSPSWSPDGKNIAFIRAGLTDDLSEARKKSILTVSSSGGEPEMLIPETDNYIFSPVWSPNGEMIAYLTKEKEAPNISYMNVVNVENRVVSIIGKVSSAYVNTELAWSPDSKQIAFNDEKGNIIKIMNLDDGGIEDIKTGLVDVNIYHLDWSPDGEQFVFGGWKGGNTEFWFMENFLPLEKLAQKKEKEDLLVRKVLSDTPIEPLGAPSPDGRYISFVDWNLGGNVSIIDLETKEKRCLTNFKNSDEQAYYSSWSPDGNQIAYCWWAYDKDQYNLSIVDVKESKSRDLFISDTIGWIELGNWSSDGKYIVATLNINGKPESQIVRVSTVDGSIQTLKTYNKSYLGGKPYLSPDSRYVAYDMPDDKASGNSDIYILSLKNEEVNNLTSHPSHDYILGWTPDGKNILFASDRSGTVDAMIIKVEDGKAKDQPGSVKQNIGPIVPMGLTKNGSFYFGQWPGADNVYTAEINFDEGKLVTKPELLIQRFEGRNYSPDYSSDGGNIAYISERGILSKGKHGLVLCIHDLATGKEIEINTDPEVSRAIRDLQWSPDDRSIALTCFNQEGYSRIYNYDLKSGKFTALVTGSNDDPSGTNYGSPVWSKDGQSIYYFKMSRYSPTSSIMARNTVTVVDRELFRYTSDDVMDRFFNISISPDGKWLAAINRGEDRVVRLISTESGETRDLYTFVSSGGQPYSQVWSRDGKYIIFPYPKQGTGIREWNLMGIPVEGGENLSIETNILRIDSPTLHPDGRTLVFSGPGYSYPENNIWEMKNFLPNSENTY